MPQRNLAALVRLKVMARLLVFVALLGVSVALPHPEQPIDKLMVEIKSGLSVPEEDYDPTKPDPILLAFQTGVIMPVDSDKAVHPDAGIPVVDLIPRHGYPLEIHNNVQTSDGYLLDLHRIPYGKTSPAAPGKPVVFLQHGLLCSSAEWVNMGVDKGLAYHLAELGYDVWMGNARGNTWSRKHIIYNPNRDSEFWNFSWEEIGTQDIPTMIDYVLAVTGQSSLYYVGHSQGTTAFFVMASERPEYNSKIRLMVALAPVVYMSHIANPFFQLLALFDDTLEFILGLLGIDEFLPNSDLFGLIGQALCNDESIFQGLCSNILFLISGWNSAQLNETMIPVIATSAPAGAATKQLIHYAQGINSARFRRYDYGWIVNLIRYGSLSPPDYNLSKVSAPIALFYSGNDWLSAVVDVDQLYRELPNVVYKYYMPDDRWNHLDYLFAIEVIPLLYERVSALIARF